MDGVDKKKVVKSILRFIKDELEGPTLDSEQKESLDVARQCLETTYDVNAADSLADDVDLLSLFTSKDDHKVSEQDQAEAEAFKVKGNDCMKNGDYMEAVKHYTRAIELNRKVAVYYSNRAAAFSRLEKHNDVIADCKEAIKLDPNYSKAYGRLGVAYSNLGMYREAKEAYGKARQLDPTNVTYEANYMLADEKLNSESTSSAGMPPGFDINSFMNNPALLNMASQMLNDPTFRNMVSGLMDSGASTDQNVEGFMHLGQQLAQQLQSSNPHFIDQLRSSFGLNQNMDQQPDSNQDQNPDSGNEKKNN